MEDIVGMDDFDDALPFQISIACIEFVGLLCQNTLGFYGFRVCWTRLRLPAQTFLPRSS